MFNTESNSTIDLYCEKYDCNENFALFDFIHDKEANHFLEPFDIRRSFNEFRPTMLMLINLPFMEKKRPRENQIYRIPLMLLKEFHWSTSNPIGALPFVALIADAHAFSTNLDGLLYQLFSHKIKLKKQFFSSDVAHESSTAKSSYPFSKATPLGLSSFVSMDTPKTCSNFKQKPDRLIVKFVGQGNWNQLISNDKCIVHFDLGCSMYYDQKKYRLLLGNDPFCDNPALIISH